MHTTITHVSTWIEPETVIASTATLGYSVLELGKGNGRVDLFLGHNPKEVLGAVERLIDELNILRNQVIKNLEA